MSIKKIYKINYKRNITAFMSSIMKYYNLTPFYSTFKDIDKLLKSNKQQKIVLMIFDGMGSNILNKHLSKKNFLRINKKFDMDAVFPPTTTASINSYLSGKNPIESGYLGWSLYFKQTDKTVTVFKNLDSVSKKPVEFNYQKEYLDFIEIGQIIQDNSDVKYYSFNPSFKPGGYNNLEELEQRLLETLKKDEKQFIYVYHDNPDLLLHNYGTNHKFVNKKMHEISKFVERIYDNSKDTSFFITADHGHTNVTPICLYTYYDLYNCLKRVPSIEGRCASFFVKDDKHKEFLKIFNDNFKEKFVLLTKKEVLKKKIFGPGKLHPNVLDCIGDYIAIAISHYYFVFTPKDHMFKSTHAGGLDKEAIIPLIFLNNYTKD